MLLTVLVEEKKCWERKSAFHRRTSEEGVLATSKRTFGINTCIGSPLCLGGVSLSES